MRWSTYLRVRIGLRSKMYSIQIENQDIRKAKGIKKNIVKRQSRHEQHKEALFEKRKYRHSMNVLRSRGHHIYGEE